jgi:integrase
MVSNSGGYIETGQKRRSCFMKNNAAYTGQSRELRPWEFASDSGDGNLTIRDAVELFMQSRSSCKANTRRTYRVALKLLVKFTEHYKAYLLSDIDAKLLNYFFSALSAPIDKKNLASGELNHRIWMDEKNRGKTYTQNYVHDLYRPINTMVRFFQKDQILPFFIYNHPRPDNRSYLPSPHEEEYFDAVDKCLTERDRIILLFMGDSALRLEETVNVNWGDISCEEERVRVRKGKCDVTRAVSLSKNMMAMLSTYKASLPPSHTGDDLPVFCSKKGNRLTPSGLQSMIKRVSDRIGNDFSAHDLRRFAMRTWNKAGRTIEDTQHAAGHADVRTTIRYLGRIDPGVTPGQRETNSLDYWAAQGKFTYPGIK